VSRRRRCALAAVVTAVLAACVPATAERDPRGGIAFLIAPSAPARGDAFVTSDGWTVRIETLVLAARCLGSHPEGGAFRGEGTRWRFRAAEPVQVVLRAVDPRLTTGVLTLDSLSQGDFDGPHNCAEAAVPCRYDQNITPEWKARFEQPADGEDDCPRESTTTEKPRGCAASSARPGFYIHASAMKEGRLLALDLALPRAEAGTSLTADVHVVPNAFTVVKVALEAERLFTNPSHVLVFDDLARADANGDGVLTAYELRRVEAMFQPPLEERRVRFADTEEDSPPLFSMYDAFIERSAKLLALVP
jgi:hypothetical protein